MNNKLTPKVSVIIPTYNCMRYVPEAVESVLNQTYRDYEIIIVDDGSIDQTRAALAKHIEAHPQKVRYIFQQNAGEGGARNRGIKEARGEYVAFLDADDIWTPQKLEIQMNLVESLKEKNIVVFGDAYAFNERGVITRSMFKEREPHEGSVFEELLYKNFVVTQTVVARRNLFAKVGYFKEGMKYCADFEMWLRLAKNYKFHYVNEAIVGYRIHSNNVSGNIHKMQEYHLKVIQDALRHTKKNNDFANKVFAMHHFRYGYNFWQNGFNADARREFWLSLRHGFQCKTLIYLLVTFFPIFFVKKMRLMKSKLPMNGRTPIVLKENHCENRN